MYVELQRKLKKQKKVRQNPAKAEKYVDFTRKSVLRGECRSSGSRTEYKNVRYISTKNGDLFRKTKDRNVRYISTKNAAYGIFRPDLLEKTKKCTLKIIKTAFPAFLLRLRKRRSGKNTLKSNEKYPEKEMAAAEKQRGSEDC